MKKIKNIFGFTLVELMVVVAVMIILTGIGAAALNKLNNSQELDSLKNEMINSLNLSRSMALTNQLPNGINDSLKFVLVTMTVGTSLRTDAVTIDSGAQTYFVKNNKAITTNNSFGFSIENGRLTDGNGILTSTPLCLSLSLDNDTDDKKYIYIETTGLIYEKNNCN